MAECMQAFFGNMNAHACQRFSFLQAQDRYKERPNKNPLAGMVFRQVSPPPLAPLSCPHARLLGSDTNLHRVTSQVPLPLPV